MASRETTVSDGSNQPEAPLSPAAEPSKYSKTTALKSILNRDDKGQGLVGRRVVVGGWVNSRKERAESDAPGQLPTPRAAAAQSQDVSCYDLLVQRVPFLRPIARILVGVIGAQPEKPAASPAKEGPFTVYLRINDGSCSSNLQVVMDSSMSLPGQVITVGTCILVQGVLQKILAPKKHVVELRVEKILHVGVVDVKSYPLTKSRISLESLRDHPHLRPRSIAVGSVTRICSNLIYTGHGFFQKKGFIHVQTPIITSMNAGNHGKMFQVTTLLSNSGGKDKSAAVHEHEGVDLEAFRASIREKSKRIDELRRSDSNKEALSAAEQDLQRSKELVVMLEKQQQSTAPSAGEMDFSNDFFSRPVYLSASAGLHLESYACALSSVYTIGPVFETDESKSAAKLAERWMIEAELAFTELQDVMNCAEDLVQSLCYSLLETAGNDLKCVSKQIEKNCIKRLKSIVSGSFARITYSEALNILNQVKDKSFLSKVGWGNTLSEEQESYLADELYKRPVIVHEYPKGVKPFYVRVSDDGRTVSAFDIIAPKVGVVVRGSQKEERMDVIIKRIQELGLPHEQYEWYIDLRKHGYVKHSGFSLDIEKMVMTATGLADVKDAIPFPRVRGHAKL
ncbi:tRNA synthetases class II (D, K and N) [Musa troglodytarum]|uniref:asparagine--tRNA ligase n=1 Tax=Musa troglodytarum TaxID=320322 RepID=A0A9E7I717_9LILI|nr:tRNA synthetases class II (D, K and N) [Musa troglodytarum]